MIDGCKIIIHLWNIQKYDLEKYINLVVVG